MGSQPGFARFGVLTRLWGPIIQKQGRRAGGWGGAGAPQKNFGEVVVEKIEFSAAEGGRKKKWGTQKK